MDSGSGTVGKAVASETKDPRFECKDWKYFYYQLY